MPSETDPISVVALREQLGDRSSIPARLQDLGAVVSHSDHYRLRVLRGKDTSSNGGKPRDAYLPAIDESDIHRYQIANDRGATDSLIDLSERSIRDVVKRAVEETGDEDCQYVSSYDLRRRFAHRLLVDHQMNPRVVMQVGGWESFQAIEPYLNAPPLEVVTTAFEEVGLE